MRPQPPNWQAVQRHLEILSTLPPPILLRHIGNNIHFRPFCRKSNIAQVHLSDICIYVVEKGVWDNIQPGNTVE
jgi:hypothetical protein